jgi:hypothetical protein
MICLLTGRANANVQMRGGKQLIARLQHMYPLGANLRALAAESAIFASTYDVFGYLIPVSRGCRPYHSGHLSLGHQCLDRVFRQYFFKY